MSLNLNNTVANNKPLEWLGPGHPKADPAPTKRWTLLGKPDHRLPDLGAAGEVAALAEQLENGAPQCEANRGADASNSHKPHSAPAASTFTATATDDE